MSYVRWGEDGSQVYAYETCSGRVAVLADEVMWSHDLTHREALDALVAARERGLRVPQFAIDALVFAVDNATDTSGEF